MSTLRDRGGTDRICKMCGRQLHYSLINKFGLCGDCNRKEVKELKTYLRVKKKLGE